MLRPLAVQKPVDATLRHTVRTGTGPNSASDNDRWSSRLTESDVRLNYEESSEITGALQVGCADSTTVQFREVLNTPQRVVLTLFTILGVGLSVSFLIWLAWPTHFPSAPEHFGPVGVALSAVGFGLLLLLETLRIVENATLWLFAFNMRDPIPMQPESHLRVAVLTTIVPSKEPISLVAISLRAMRQITYEDGQVDIWILDEGDDPEVRRTASDLGVRHFTRKGLPEYNQPTGPFRAKTKSGNLNAWRAEHELEYDVVAQMDADHMPLPGFLSRSLGYFRDPDVAFVVAPQVYGNLTESLQANGAADLCYLFHGVIQRGGNGLDAPLLIGTNHLYRVTAWSQIGGYQDSIIEDHLTSLLVHGSVNPTTGALWKGVYTPDVLSVGEGPHSWTDYFNQQRRWAYGVWEIIMNHSPRLMRKLPRRRALVYASLELYYPSVGVIWTVGSLLTALYLILGITVIHVEMLPWLFLWAPSVLSQFFFFVWLRRFNLAEHERRGIGWTGLLLTLATGPIYVSAGFSALLRKPLTYAVTAKSNLASADSWTTFRPHFKWMWAALTMLLVSFITHHNHWPLRMWAVFTLISVMLPVIHVLMSTPLPDLPRPVLSFPIRLSARVGTAVTILVLVGSMSAFVPASSEGLGALLPLHVTPVVAPSLVPSNGAKPSATAVGLEDPVPQLPELPTTATTRPLFGVFDEQGLSNVGNLAEIYFQWGEQPQAMKGYVNYVTQRGQIPLITWEPRYGPISNQLLPSEVSLLGNIAAGKQDTYVRSVAASLARTKQPIIIRFAEEMDLATTGLHPWAGQNPSTYVAAYRRVVDIFRSAGASNVRWLWSPSGHTDASGHLAAMPYYPGDGYVDYTGFSAFILWQWEEGSPELQAIHAYRSPISYLSKPVADLAALGHPVIIPELGIDLYSSETSQEQAWLREAASEMVAGSFPRLVGVVYFNAPHNWTDVHADWRLSPAAMNAFLTPLETGDVLTGPSATKQSTMESHPQP